MIAGCPKCTARYRVDLDQIGEKGAKLRCTKCSAVFLVRAPQPTPSASTPEPVPERVVPVAKTEEPPRPQEASVDADSERLVLIADPNDERGKRTSDAIEDWGLVPVLVHDGVEAILSIQRRMPKVVVLDAALPKMFGFQICEIVKRNESLRHIRVVLIGAIHHQDRYRRDPSDLYGADVYLEQPDLPDGLMPLLREARMPVSEVSAPVEPHEVAAPEPTSTPATPPIEASGELEMPAALDPVPETPAAPEFSFDEPVAVPTPTTVDEPISEPASDESSEISAERERAERLARIAVSEMLLYQPEKFDQAVRDGNIEAVLDLEIQEARALIRQRISEEVRAEKDFILVELERVTRERSTTV